MSASVAESDGAGPAAGAARYDPAAMALHVRGGTGRELVDPAEIRRLADLVAETAAVLARASGMLASAADETGHEAGHAPVAAAATHAALEEARGGAWGTLPLEGRLVELEVALRHAGHLYEAAEQAAQPPPPPPSVWRYLPFFTMPAIAVPALAAQAATDISRELAQLGHLPFSTGSPVIDQAVDRVLALAGRAHGGPRRLPPTAIALDGAVRQLGHHGQLSLPWFAAPDTFVLGHRAVELAQTTPQQRFAVPLAAVASIAPALLAGGGRGYGVRTTPDLPPRRVAPPRSLAQSLRAVAELRPDNGAVPGSIQVRRTDHPDGRRSWTVLVPSTQDMHVGRPNPVDNLSNIQAYAGFATDVEAGIIAALGQSGARPAEPVALVGHSQGGLTSMRLAADPLVRARFNVTTVVTAGSPVGHLPSPEGVAVLNLEHLEDPFLGLDGTENPAEADRVTVSRSLATEAGWRTGILAEESHDLATYVRTAQLAGADPEVARIAEGLAEVTGRPGVSTTATTFVVRRVPARG